MDVDGSLFHPPEEPFLFYPGIDHPTNCGLIPTCAGSAQARSAWAETERWRRLTETPVSGRSRFAPWMPRCVSPRRPSVSVSSASPSARCTRCSPMSRKRIASGRGGKLKPNCGNLKDARGSLARANCSSEQPANRPPPDCLRARSFRGREPCGALGQGSDVACPAGRLRRWAGGIQIGRVREIEHG